MSDKIQIVCNLDVSLNQVSYTQIDGTEWSLGYIDPNDATWLRMKAEAADIEARSITDQMADPKVDKGFVMELLRNGVDCDGLVKMFTAGML